MNAQLLPDATYTIVPTEGESALPTSLYTRLRSDEPGVLFVQGEMRNKVCLRTDTEGKNGELVISKAHRLHSDVLSYEERVKRSGVAFTVRLATVTDLIELYRGSEGNGEGDKDSSRQTAMLGLIRDAATRGASDVHFYIQRKVCRIRFRIHGQLETQRQYECTREEGLLLVRTMYNSMCMEAEPALDENREQDAQLQHVFAEKAKLTGSRIATRPAVEKGLLVVLRLMLPDDGKPVTLESLGYLPEQHDQIVYMTARTHGINIFSGITGSGKSTSLKACIELLADTADQRIHILTLESPTEYSIRGEGVVQTPVNTENNGWPRAIKNAVRLDPDVIMIGEIRDPESATTAFDAAMTGHGLWSTLHTADAPSILLRLRRLGVDEDFLFDPSTVTGLINQSLVPTLCQKCAIPFHENRHVLSPAVIKRIEQACPAEALNRIQLQGAGCKECRGLGVTGRTVVAEVITPTAAFMQTFRDAGKLAARKQWVASGGITKLAHLITMIAAGRVDPRHGERVCGPLDQDAVTLGGVE
jgi:type II secretory ATPase GspE/PulE/Tfp pilus assembly ATPase PilB-like protein